MDVLRGFFVVALHRLLIYNLKVCCESLITILLFFGYSFVHVGNNSECSESQRPVSARASRLPGRAPAGRDGRRAALDNLY